MNNQQTQYTYLIGIDGGGTKTHARVERMDGTLVAIGNSGPSGLTYGSDKAWLAIISAINDAFQQAEIAQPPYVQIAIGLGLAGVNNKQWCLEFSAHHPGFGAMVVDTDAFTTLLGAHQGQPGAIVTIGTGSVGQALFADGRRCEVGGWGFPSGDEASGGWIGLCAINHTQHVLDGRAATGSLSQAIIAFCGGSDAHSNSDNRDCIFAWQSQASQNTYAQLAPLVVSHAAQDPAAHHILLQAGQEIAHITHALDPAQQLPLALCGGLAKALTPYLPTSLQARALTPQADPASGALFLIQRKLKAYGT